MRRIRCFLLCIALVCSILAIPVSAAIFQISYYTENVYAGGIIDMYAIADNGGVKPYTYQWQVDLGIGDGHWADLEENANYVGTKTNHLQIRTKTGEYSDWNVIPFQCVVTDAEGTTLYSPNIYADIYPTSELIPNMKKWGYGLYEPTLTNVKNLSTSDDVNYTADAYAGSKIELLIGSKPVEDRAILVNSEVKLTRQIYITEYGKTIKTVDHTTYIPYTVGNVKVEFKLNLKIGDTDLGDFDVKTVNITTTKPDAIARGVTKSECSMLRYPYNESETLGSLPQGAVVQVLGKEGGYYQVYVRSVISYIPESLLRLDEPVGEAVIKNVDVTIDAPAAGEKPSFGCNILTTGCELYKTEPISWYDETAKKFLTANDPFREGHSYTLSIWLATKNGYRFQLDSAGNPKLTGSINTNLPPFIYKAYEQDPEKVIELRYTFHNVKHKEPEQTHICTPVLVDRVEPGCTEKGREAYYRCSCGMHYSDSKGQTVIDLSKWGILPATGHKPSEWRITQIFHYKVCTVCGDYLEDQDHTGGTATCTQGPKCTVCGSIYGEPNDHRWSPTWLYKEKAGHAWICADCKTHSNVEQHTPGPAATETKPQTCKDCGYIITPVKNHTHKLKKVARVSATCILEGNVEYYTCEGCADIFVDDQGQNKFPAGMELSIAPLGHEVSDKWYTDGTYHWRVCTRCAEVLDETKMLHEITGNTCATCGHQKQDAKPTEDTKPAEATKPSGGTELTEATKPALSTDPAEATKPQPTGKPEETPTPSETAPPQKTPQSNANRSPNGLLAVVMVASVSFAAAIVTAVIILKKKK